MKTAEPDPNSLQDKKAVGRFNQQPVLFRCDGSAEIGLGHIVRCMTIAAAFREEGCPAIRFLMRHSSEKIVRKISDAGFAVALLPPHVEMEKDLKETIFVVRTMRRNDYFPLVVTDSHDFPAEFYVGLKEAGLMVFSIDDYAGVSYASDIVLNHNIAAYSYCYEVQSYTKLLLGPAYFPLREEFRRRLGVNKAPRAAITNIVVSLGGIPAVDDFERVIAGIRRFAENQSNLQVSLVLGLQEEAKFIRGLPASYRIVAEGDDLAAVVHDADVAIVNGGVTAYEAASLGLPLIMISMDSNQDETLSGFSMHGACLPLGRDCELDVKVLLEALAQLRESPDLRRELGERARLLVDGKGIERILDEIVELSNFDPAQG